MAKKEKNKEKDKSKLTASEKENLESLQKKKKDILEMLSRLEEKKEATRPHIYDKVKADYEERLSSLEEELKGKEEAIQKELERIATEKQELSGQIEALEEELEEITLRHDTGEYNDKAFGKIEEEKKAELEPLQMELEELEEEEAPFRELVGARESVGIEEELAEEIVELEEPVKPGRAPEAEEEVEELLAIEEPVEVEEDRKAPKLGQEFLAEEAALKESERELEELIKELEDSGVEIDEEEKAAAAIEEETEEEIPKEVEKAKDILSDEEIFKEEEKELEELLGAGKEKGEASEPADKGLVCKKCGTANKPDSWYCEKCGAELIEAET